MATLTDKAILRHLRETAAQSARAARRKGPLTAADASAHLIMPAALPTVESYKSPAWYLARWLNLMSHEDRSEDDVLASLQFFLPHHLEQLEGWLAEDRTWEGFATAFTAEFANTHLARQQTAVLKNWKQSDAVPCAEFAAKTAVQARLHNLPAVAKSELLYYGLHPTIKAEVDQGLVVPRMALNEGVDETWVPSFDNVINYIGINVVCVAFGSKKPAKPPPAAEPSLKALVAAAVAAALPRGGSTDEAKYDARSRQREPLPSLPANHVAIRKEIVTWAQVKNTGKFFPSLTPEQKSVLSHTHTCFKCRMDVGGQSHFVRDCPFSAEIASHFATPLNA